MKTYLPVLLFALLLPAVLPAQTDCNNYLAEAQVFYNRYATCSTPMSNPLRSVIMTRGYMIFRFDATGTGNASAGRDKSVRSFTIDDEQMAAFIRKHVKRKLTRAEWVQYVGLELNYD